MKQVIVILAFILGGPLGFTQELKSESPNAEDNSIYNTAGVEVRPEFPGGIQEFYNFVGRNYKTPNVKNLKGKIFVTFVVEKDGSLSDIKVLRDIGHGTGEEAVRVLKECPKWLPAEQNGKKVRVLYSLPISIQLP
jgi:protein TonB